MTDTVWLIEWPASRQDVVRYWHPTEGRVIDPHHSVWFCREADAAATRSPSDQLTATLFSCGGDLSTEGTGKRASSARSSATRDRTSRPSLSDRLTQSLITSGLVCGITPSSIRGLSDQPIRVLAFAMPGGGDAGKRSAVCSSSKGPDAQQQPRQSTGAEPRAERILSGEPLQTPHPYSEGEET